MNNHIDLSKYQNALSRRNQILRFIWSIAWFILARPFPRSFGNKWRIFLLRVFGAKVSWKCGVYSNCKIWAPWNLVMDDFSTLGPAVNCYNVDKVIIGKNVLVSQFAYLCTASHNYESKKFELITKPIIIKDNVWIGASSFINMGIIIYEGSIVAATSTVVKNVNEWIIVGGNPAKEIKKRNREIY